MEERPHHETCENQSDEEQNRAEDFIPSQVHEVKDNKYKLDGREHGKQAKNQLVGQGKANKNNFETGDDAEDHCDLHINVQPVRFLVAMGGRSCDSGNRHVQRYSMR